MAAKCPFTVKVRLPESSKKKRSYTLCVDTGASTTWMLANSSEIVKYELDASEGKNRTNRKWLPVYGTFFPEKKSLPSTFKASGPLLRKQYADGTLLHGSYTSERVVVRLSNRKPIQREIILGVVEKVNEYWVETFKRQKVSGYLGLGLPSNNRMYEVLNNVGKYDYFKAGKLKEKWRWRYHAFLHNSVFIFRIGPGGFNFFHPDSSMFEHALEESEKDTCLPIADAGYWKTSILKAHLAMVSWPALSITKENWEASVRESNGTVDQNRSKVEGDSRREGGGGSQFIHAERKPEDDGTTYVLEMHSDGHYSTIYGDGSDAEMEREDYYDSTNLVVHLDSGSEGIFLPNRFLSAMVINSTWDLTLTFPEKKTPVVIKNLKVGRDLGFLPPTPKESTKAQSPVHPDSPNRPLPSPTYLEIILGAPFFNRQPVVFVSKQEVKKTKKTKDQVFEEEFYVDKKPSCVFVS